MFSLQTGHLRRCRGWLTPRRSDWVGHLAHYPQGAGAGSTGGVSGTVGLELFVQPGRRLPDDPRGFTDAGADYHIPVLLEEVVHFLTPTRGSLFLDGTLGGGGHTRRLLEEGANVIGLDQDPDALDFSRRMLSGFGDSFSAIQANFRSYGDLLATVGIQHGLDGILLDLGVSSRQLENAGRGFSFQTDGPLDMRMNPSAELTAETVVNQWEEDELIRVFREYGEERAAKRIARAIVLARRQQTISTTLQLANLVESVVPRRGRQHPATRVFQALRIAVNDEFGALESALDEAHQWLRPGGRLAVITFHSLEDRIVKKFMRRQCLEWIDRPEFPEPKPNPECYFDLVVRKPLVPSEEEVAENPRARSAKLRVVERRTANEKATK
jgi:16S rRNA (cytosine1402-N4)-methyltransferase